MSHLYDSANFEQQNLIFCPNLSISFIKRLILKRISHIQNFLEMEVLLLYQYGSKYRLYIKIVCYIINKQIKIRAETPACPHEVIQKFNRNALLIS